MVYRAEDTQLHRVVALKFLSDAVTLDPKASERLRREARIASSLNHPNVCSIYEVGEQSGDVFIAMEFVEGRSLSKEIPFEGLPVESVIRYGLQIASALDHAHARGVIHRDLKPANVIVTPEGNVKILDFGLARRAKGSDFDEKSIQTDSAQTDASLTGTFPYMAPEQLEGSGTSRLTDLWSLGIVLYEATTGSRPFKGENLYQVWTSIVRDRPPSLPPNIHPALATIIHRCLEKDPARRYQSAGELRAALEACAAPESAARPVGEESVRLRRAFAAVAVIVLCGFGALALRGTHFLSPRNDPAIPSRILLGVLPSSSADISQSAYENGLADTLNARLGGLTAANSLEVIPTNEMREKHINTIEGARQQFGINLALTFNMQRAGNQTRVNYTLVDPASLRQIHSGTITASADDPFALQDQVFESVLAAMHLKFESDARSHAEAYGTQQPAAYDFYLQGLGYLQDYVKAENVDNAIEVFDRALAKDPAFASANAGLGEAYWRKYQLTHDIHWADVAILNCRQAAKLDAALASAHICLGRVFLGTGKYEQALHEYDRAIEIEPNSDAAQAGLAYGYEQLNRPEDAERTFKKAIAARPNYWATYNWLGLFYQRHGRYDDASAMYSQVVSLAPDSFTGYSNLGGIRVIEGKYAEAIPLLQQSLKIRATPEAASNLATALFQMRRYPEASVQFEEAVKLDDKDYQLWGNLGDAYYWTPGRHNEATAAYRKAIRLGEQNLRVNPHDSEALGYLATYYAMCGDRSMALERLDNAVALNPKSPEVLFNAALVYQQLGEPTRAIDELEQAVAEGASASTLSDTPNFDTLHSNQRFLNLLQR